MNQTQLEVANDLAKKNKIDMERISFLSPYTYNDRFYGIICVDGMPAVVFSPPQKGDEITAAKQIWFQQTFEDNFRDYLTTKVTHRLIF